MVLDPVREHFKTSQSGYQGSVKDELRKERGFYRDRYRAEATRGLWGQPGARCGAFTLLRAKEGRLTVMPGLCDRWVCPICGTRRAAWLRTQIQAAVDGGLCSFWTLTIRAPNQSMMRCISIEAWRELDARERTNSYRRVKAAWNIVRTDLVKKHGPLAYVWTAEATKRGYAHLHLCTSLQVSAGELSDMWRSATDGSWIVDVQPIETDKVAGYLAKYVCQQVAARPPGLEKSRAFSKSRSLAFTRFRGKASKPDDWHRYDRPYWEVLAKLAGQQVPLLGGWTQGVPSATFAAGLIAGVPAPLWHVGAGPAPPLADDP